MSRPIAESVSLLSETLTNCKTNLKDKGVESDTIKISDVDEKIAEIQAGGDNTPKDKPKYYSVTPTTIHDYDNRITLKITVSSEQYNKFKEDYPDFEGFNIDFRIAENGTTLQDGYARFGYLENSENSVSYSGLNFSKRPIIYISLDGEPTNKWIDFFSPDFESTSY